MVKLPEGSRLETGEGGLERLVLSTARAEAHVYRHGAHVTHFQPAGERPVLFLSRQSQFAAGKPIRGGVPICFPWFGPKADDAAAPLHGFARLLEWALVSIEKDADGALVATLELRSDEYTHRFLPHVFSVRMVVSAGRSLRLALAVHNHGDQPFRFAEALHSYFAVGDARQLRIAGLERARYVDKTDAGALKTLGDAPLTIAGETDRVFTGHAGRVAIEDPAWQRRIRVERTGSATAVVWNPWLAKAKAMPDFGDDEWTEMVCVESANALDDALTLPPGASHELTTTIAVEPA
jgi:glucose-6-phosphate 1-epimerase